MIEIKQRELPVTISSSKIKLFLECKAKYFFKYLTTLSVKEKVWPGTLFGKTCHSLTEDLIKYINEEQPKGDIIKLLKDQFGDRFKIEREKETQENNRQWKTTRGYNEEEFIRVGNKYSNLLIKFLLQIIPTDLFELHSELELSHPWIDPNINLKGIIDLIFFYNDPPPRYSINDLKVTKKSSKYYFVDWDRDIQSLIYEYLTFKEYNFYADNFDFLVMNYEENNIFLKRKIIEINTKNSIDYYNYLNIILQEMKSFIVDPKITLKEKNTMNNCSWCEYGAWCKAYEKNN
jgi:hypothetical protein